MSNTKLFHNIQNILWELRFFFYITYSPLVMLTIVVPVGLPRLPVSRISIIHVSVCMCVCVYFCFLSHFQDLNSFIHFFQLFNCIFLIFYLQDLLIIFLKASIIFIRLNLNNFLVLHLCQILQGVWWVCCCCMITCY